MTLDCIMGWVDKGGCAQEPCSPGTAVLSQEQRTQLVPNKEGPLFPWLPSLGAVSINVSLPFHLGHQHSAGPSNGPDMQLEEHRAEQRPTLTQSKRTLQNEGREGDIQMPSHPMCPRGLRARLGYRGFWDRHTSRIMARCGVHYHSHLLGSFSPLLLQEQQETQSSQGSLMGPDFGSHLYYLLYCLRHSWEAVP